MKTSKLFISLIIILYINLANAEVRKAPEWDISEWINGTGTTLSELKGKVVVVEFFQLWCPGCKSFSLPLMERWEKTFADDIAADKIVMMSIHTVFEGHSYQTTEKLRDFLKEKGITRLVGVDRLNNGNHIPETMKIYHTRGTPEMAIIDQNGYVRFQYFGGFNAEPVEQFIRKLIDKT